MNFIKHWCSGVARSFPVGGGGGVHIAFFMGHKFSFVHSVSDIKHDFFLLVGAPGGTGNLWGGGVCPQATPIATPLARCNMQGVRLHED